MRALQRLPWRSRSRSMLFQIRSLVFGPIALGQDGGDAILLCMRRYSRLLALITCFWLIQAISPTNRFLLAYWFC